MPQTDEEKILYFRSLEQEVTQAEGEWEQAKAEASEKKKVFDGRVDALREAIRKATDPQTSLELDTEAEVIDDSHQIGPRGLLPESPADDAGPDEVAA
jgi:hypothetical protein